MSDIPGYFIKSVPYDCIEYRAPLLPCPFCGGEAHMKKTRRWPSRGTRQELDCGVDGYTVICINYANCPIYGADTMYYRKPQTAAKLWNRRVG